MKQKYALYLFGSLALITVIIRLPSVFATLNFAVDEVKIFAQSSYDYQIRYQQDPLARTILEVKNKLPHGARFAMSPAEWNNVRALARFSLYPEAELNEDYDYFLNFDGSTQVNFNEWQSETVANGVVLYARPGSRFIDSKTEVQAHGLLRLFGFVALVLLYMTLGIVIIGRLNLNLDRRHFWWALGLSYLIGFTILNTVLWLYLMLGGTLTRASIMIAWLILVLIQLSYKPKKLLYQLFRLVKRISVHTLPRYKKSKVWYISAALALFFVLSLVILALVQPVMSWDAISFWILKSKAIFDSQMLDLSYTTHNFYPINWSLHHALQFTLLGFIDMPIVKWHVALLIVILLTQVYGASYYLLESKMWSRYAMITYALLFLGISSTFARAETIYLALVSSLAAVSIVMIRRNFDLQSILLVTILAMGLSMIKIEGLVMSFIIMFSSLFIYRKKIIHSSQRLWIVMPLAISMLLNIVWVLWLRSHGFLDQLHHWQSSVTLKKIGSLLWLAPDILSSAPHHGLVLSIVAVLLVYIGFKITDLEKYLLFISVGLITFIFVAISGWSIDNIASSSHATRRLFLHAAPFLTLLSVSMSRRIKHNLRK